MARKPRLEFAGATNHVISRGNSRKPIFDGGSGLAFEKTLFETCEKCGWLRHAYVIMNNHYRLALETPQANLVEGMRWLQGTFGIRFNAYHRERGHVFQSRYKSLVIEEGRPLLGMVNYIHLNPVRAGLVELRDLHAFLLSSFPKFFAKCPRSGLSRSRFLAALEFPNSPSGMKRHAEHLEFSEENDLAARDEISRRYCRGWAVASQEYRKELKAAFAESNAAPDPEGAEWVDLREAKWEKRLRSLMKATGKTASDATRDAKSAAWKIKITRELRAKSTATKCVDRRTSCHGSPNKGL